MFSISGVSEGEEGGARVHGSSEREYLIDTSVMPDSRAAVYVCRCMGVCVCAFLQLFQRTRILFWFVEYEYQVINDKSHENPGTPGTQLQVFRNNLEMLCHPMCDWLYVLTCRSYASIIIS